MSFIVTNNCTIIHAPIRVTLNIIHFTNAGSFNKTAYELAYIAFKEFTHRTYDYFEFYKNR